MIVQPAAWRSELVQAVAKVTRVSIVDLLNGAGQNAQDRQAVIAALRGNSTVSARVLETRADGVSVLQLATARVALRLNAPPPPGEPILISFEASPEALANAPDTPGGTGASDTQTLQKTLAGHVAGKAAAAVLADDVRMAGANLSRAAAQAPEVVLSRSARLINDIQKSTLNQTVIETPAVSPIAESSASPETLAHALQQTVRSSGLFYESHLKGWVDGRISLSELAAEPQAHIAAGPPHETQATAVKSDTHAVVHPQLEPLVRQQLDTFEQQRIAWHGPIWPNQQADLVITGDAQPADTQTPRTWRVQLALDTPTLGSIKAEVTLTGRLLNVHVNGTGNGVHALQRGREALEQALGAHDLQVQAVHISGDAS